ncbi:hypothetical protein B0H13DRAFT_2098909 [Mycena leptocephala]|nr:hypothetical protein B0H13DRAFT_2098909 [Mycena leptocephala]
MGAESTTSKRSGRFADAVPPSSSSALRTLCSPALVISTAPASNKYDWALPSPMVVPSLLSALAPAHAPQRTPHAPRGVPPSSPGSSSRVRAKSVYDARGDPTATQSQSSFSHPPAPRSPHYIKASRTWNASSEGDARLPIPSPTSPRPRASSSASPRSSTSSRPSTTSRPSTSSRPSTNSRSSTSSHSSHERDQVRLLAPDMEPLVPPHAPFAYVGRSRVLSPHRAHSPAPSHTRPFACSSYSPHPRSPYGYAASSSASSLPDSPHSSPHPPHSLYPPQPRSPYAYAASSSASSPDSRASSPSPPHPHSRTPSPEEERVYEQQDDSPRDEAHPNAYGKEIEFERHPDTYRKEMGWSGDLRGLRIK